MRSSPQGTRTPSWSTCRPAPTITRDPTSSVSLWTRTRSPTVSKTGWAGERAARQRHHPGLQLERGAALLDPVGPAPDVPGFRAAGDRGRLYGRLGRGDGLLRRSAGALAQPAAELGKPGGTEQRRPGAGTRGGRRLSRAGRALG